ncbi:YitT family protein [Staphylococcus massiliensis]|uniref:Membrane protein n=1 Tax=Staphylococcus massiliensis S46 TaxID=1229783 RepID=K9AL97_9STAP|nr:YitT family protein [Staphylococcus massiliensis]EKU48148.1 membrane protein [Staphylococcus massiliensis S46]MCG3399591.1 YitT family protein [Staphylococcus massiliensis]MCG3402101.1 YitT family protein [Staphylococcus massiliensis]MCG3412948.1 YitT family protein [Staphylococcus massiliensis]POA00962.1 YitT family protein [Staphylococcus massiliensis CCUG 55927]
MDSQLKQGEHTERKKKFSLKQFIKRFIFLTIGAVLMAVGLELFLVPNKLLDGGIVGISIILSHLTGVKLGIFIFVLNLPFFFLGYKQIGKTFALSTLYAITVLSVSTALLHPVPPFIQEKFLVTIFGGAILGIGVGLVIRYGGSLDGTEILSILINKKVPFSVGEIVMIINFFIFTVAGFIFTWESAMFSVIAYFIAFKMIDTILLGIDESKAVWVISDEYKEIGEAINARLGRGVTYLHGEGAYSGEDRRVVFCVITRLEEAKLKDIVMELDEKAFLSIGNVSEVYGGHHRKKDIH